jgi:hypothetical protein
MKDRAEFVKITHLYWLSSVLGWEAVNSILKKIR